MLLHPDSIRDSLTPMKIAILACLLGSTAFAGPGPAPDKTRYHLFRPTPHAEMREMSTDRPDQTESAYTVDAGHFQIEMDLMKLTYDRHRPSWNVAPVNLKAGLLNNVDLQIVLDNYVRESGGASGFGDITARLLKSLCNCWKMRTNGN